MEKLAELLQKRYSVEERLLIKTSQIKSLTVGRMIVEFPVWDAVQHTSSISSEGQGNIDHLNSETSPNSCWDTISQ